MRNEELGKWPRLIVLGQPVTEEQADEIILRTELWYGFGGTPFTERAARMMGVELDEYGAATDAGAEWLRARLDCLDLEYLHSDRIQSAYFAGEYGWCDWDGKIRCANYSIGKWPTVDEIHDEWAAIAQAFPFLDLHAQAAREPESGDEETEVLAQWRVVEGTARLVDRTAPLLELVAPIWASEQGHLGVGLGRLRRAHRRVYLAAMTRTAEYYRTHDTADLDEEVEVEVSKDPHISQAVRLTRNEMRSLYAVAREQGTTVEQLMHHWVQTGLAGERNHTSQLETES